VCVCVYAHQAATGADGGAKEEAQQTKMVYEHCNLFGPTATTLLAMAAASAPTLSLATLYSLISHEAAAAAGPLLTYIWFRTSSSSQTCGQAGNGNSSQFQFQSQFQSQS